MQADTPLIMVIDDNPINLELLEEILFESGYRVVCCDNSEIALDQIRSHCPALILMDIMMPNVSGYDLCRQLKADQNLRTIPVIFISALDANEDKLKAFSSGGVDYVTKPFYAPEILARVNTHLSLVITQNKLQEHIDNLGKIVAERTRELARTNRRLLEINRLQDDFIAMLAHEIRTPANGILGLGGLILEEVPDSPLHEPYAESCQRLQNLIDDTTLLSTIETAVNKPSQRLTLRELMEHLQSKFPSLQLTTDFLRPAEDITLRPNAKLLIKAATTLVQLAAAFCQPNTDVHIQISENGEFCWFYIPLDNLTLTRQQADEFLQLECRQRAYSAAESLGLAPVVAHAILTANGGNLRMLWHRDNIGSIDAEIPIQP